MYEGELYRKSFDGPLLLCVSQLNVQKVLYEVHSGYGSLIGGRSLATKITLMGFFWPTMVRDSADFVLKCEAFQKLGNIPQQSPTTMTPIIKPIPFAMWGIDLVGKLPKAKGSAEFVVVAVDYFSKWAEAAPLTKIKEGDIMRVKGRQFRVGNLVLKLYSASYLKDVNKLRPKWEGPYHVSRVLGPDTFELEEMDGKPVPRTWHASKLSKFYCYS
ncbi:hypothetical protein LIER_11739 [Lithospermum erythrorhizon]|uniref:Integrase zinc-binding domain-containing protein n=1 Tax=Lithospermum erythrorhizon TaxID=34254 RepID=A0AAV3PR06_LITER